MRTGRGADAERAPLRKAWIAFAVASQLALWALGRWALLGERGAALRELDARGLAWMADHRSPALDRFFEAVTHFGSFAVTGPLALVVIAVLAVMGSRGRAWFVLWGFGGAVLCAQIGKVLVARARPESADAIVARPGDLSFPSAHATQVLALVLVVVVVARWRSLPTQVVAPLAGALVVALVALSRVYLQVHHPTDVVAGLASATAWVVGLRLATGPVD